MPVRNNTVLTVLILSQLIAGSTYLVVKLGLREFDPFSLGLIRFLIAGIVFSLLLAGRKDFRWFEKGDLGHFLWLALLSVPLNQGLFLYGMKYTLASHGALLYASTPIMVLCLSCLVLGERPTFLKIAGILLGLCGVLLVLFDRGLEFARHTITGDLLVLGGVITWSLYTIYSKKLLEKYRPLEVTGFSLSLGALLFLPVGLPFALRMDFSWVTGAGLFALLYLALMTSV
ncbi:MAG: DMT family transporter, partial [Candidatus Edwardsbacteria bacterium]|nr:DMT family transporter [Candidatus Edwardsbacteria bacterium]